MTYFRLLVIIISIIFFLIKNSFAENSIKKYLKDSELKLFEQALKEGDRAKWSRSLKNLSKINHPTAKKIIKWRWLIAHDGIAKTEQLKEFYIKNEDWPLTNKIRNKIEAKFSPSKENISKSWFQNYPPLSGLGKIKFAELLLKNKFNQEAAWLIKNAWINNNFSYSEEKYILKNYKKFISKDAHEKRIERLIWSRTWGSARRQLKRVDKNVKLFSIAKIKLARRRGNVDSAISNVPKSFKNRESLVYERVKWRRRARLEKSSLELLNSYKGDFSKTKQWWREINYHVRKQISYGNYKEAVYLLKKFSDGSPKNNAESNWMMGWISLTFLKDPSTSYEHFKRMYNSVITPISKARASYWAGKSAKALGDLKSSENWFNKSSAFPSTFYGQLAIKETSKTLSMPKIFTKFENDEFERFKDKELVKALLILLDAKHKRLSRLFAYHLVKKATTTKEILMLSALLKKKNNINLSIMVSKRAIYKGIYIPSLNFPLPDKKLFEDVKKSTVISIPATLAIMRQESAFDISAVSRAGARGLMQVMPRTARLTAKKINYKYIRKNLTRKASYNVIIGSSYFKEMLEKFNGSYVLALTAYNAGPNRAVRWLKNYGDPRKSEIDVVTWIELIPISETRNYVQRVIEGIYMYEILTSENSMSSNPKEIKLF